MRNILLRAIHTFALLMGFAFVIHAQATRTWVSGVGDDINPCSRTAPCKTFAGAISKTATNGEINCLDPAGFGAVTVTKSITIDCEDTQGSLLSAGTNGIIVNITAATDTKKAVKIRGLSINGAGTGISGIRIVAASTLNVEEVVIDGCTQHGISVEGNSQVVVKNSTIRSNAGAGISGLSTSGPIDIMVVNSLLNGNGTGISAGSGTVFRLSGNTIAFNTTGLSAPQGKIVSFRNNSIDGNGTNGAPTSTVTQQ
jgi:Periplasmic copper-binding protein (NosD)